MSTGHFRELPLAAVLFDRDGTLVHDVPYNGDPDRVRLLPGAAEAVALARSAGLATGVVSNQSGVGRGLLTEDEVRRVDERVDALLGGLDTWLHCPHLPDAGCPCRKPRPGLILAAAARLGVSPHACLVIGDIAADVEAAHAAGARAALVPNAATAPAETERYAAEHAPDALTALRRALAQTPAPAGTQAPRTPPKRPEAGAAVHASDAPATVHGSGAVVNGATSAMPATGRTPVAPATVRTLEARATGATSDARVTGRTPVAPATVRTLEARATGATSDARATGRTPEEPATVHTPDARAAGDTSGAPALGHPGVPSSPRAQDGTRPRSVPRPNGETRRAVGRWSP
ncbi:HAD family hydrolase [Streptomyces sp. L2]|uniref:HAD-IIIA family hydrolase n=1 Tax=Streptomyces sp. L2 TaxID=2162665 RepID=UPI0010114CAC